MINMNTAELVRAIPIPTVGDIRVSSDAQRIYVSSDVEVKSLVTGQVLARAGTGGRGVGLLALDETRGVLVLSTFFGQESRIFAVNATTLAPVAELGPGLFGGRYKFQLAQTQTERAVLVFSRQITSPNFSACSIESPRVDVFDDRTFALATRIDLQGRCPAILQLPSR